jgi:selenium-binding protein 1
MPVEGGGDGYGYDLAVNPTKNVLLTSSFTGHANYMRPLGELIKDEAAMKRFGNTMVAWDLKAMKPKTVMQVPGAPLEIRWSLHPGDDWAITAAALTSKLWLVRPGRERPMAGQGGRDHRRPHEDPAARRHQHPPGRARGSG